jgi:hypothetical protein
MLLSRQSRRHRRGGVGELFFERRWWYRMTQLPTSQPLFTDSCNLPWQGWRETFQLQSVSYPMHFSSSSLQATCPKAPQLYNPNIQSYYDLEFAAKTENLPKAEDIYWDIIQEHGDNKMLLWLCTDQILRAYRKIIRRTKQSNNQSEELAKKAEAIYLKSQKLNIDDPALQSK